ncbi:LIM domain-binding protein 3-like isoform X2 [Haliotis cracherodii]|uniref:LIM domain-binding protein 3-like isoform X2 n=1 Tax=Haliotis cracherodii TaxID=6455 RepID=UPI0039EAA459
MTGFSKFQVRLFRDSFNTPWGFRLQGGKDLNQALIVQRVFSNSPAEGVLQRGDVIVSIGNRNSDELTHKQAKDLIEGGGGQINLVVTRPPPGRHDTQASTFRTPAPVAPRTNPPKAMPSYGGGGGSSAGHKPKKVNLSNLGGGGPDFGSDFSRPHLQAPQQSSRPSYRPAGGQGQMLNKVQESLDSIIFSPRSPDPYQPAPFYGQQQQQQKQQQQQQIYQQPTQQQQTYQQPAPPPPFLPNMSMGGPVSPGGGYRPTFEQIDSGQYAEEEENFVPVWERRKNFQDQRPSVTTSVRATPIPKVPRPAGKSPDAPSFGIDYSAPVSRSASLKWTPQQAPPRQHQQPVQSEPPRYQNEPEVRAPWRESLRTTGVKPWDVDLDYTSQQPTPRSGAFHPLCDPQAATQFNPNPAAPTLEEQGEGENVNGPKVVHLQYNSPMGLYSKENVQETKDGQTKATLGQPQAPASAPSQAKPAKEGDRDWNQSAVFRMIQQEERRPGQGPPRAAPAPAPARGAPVPPPAPKPAPQFQASAKFSAPPQFNAPSFEDELGVSDF